MTETMFVIGLATMLGAVIGSFLNVCISGLPYDESLTTPRSHCPRCGSGIAWWDNIPVLSFALLGGRCRNCRAPISWRYPAVEFLTATLFYMGAARWGMSWETVKWCLFAAIMIELVFSDFETRILPDEFTLWGIVLGVSLAPVSLLPGGILPFLFGQGRSEAYGSLVNSLGAGILLPLVLWTIGALYMRLRGREGLGFGDVKMVGTMGAFMGLEGAMLAILGASVFGAVGGGLWILIRRKDSRTEELPFGSFLGMASLAAMWWAA